MRLRPIFAGVAIVGVVDLAFAIAFWWWRANVPPMRIMQSIARGVLGRDAFAGGAGTAALGVALHFFIAFAMGMTFAVVAHRASVLVRDKLVVAFGLAYGLALYAVMNFVVLPLSRAGEPSFADVLWVALGIAFHAAFGVVFALAAKRAIQH